MHDTGGKVVLGQKIKGGGIEDGERVLDLLARHPSTARFIATKLARRFVADEPPAALVDRAAAAFRATDGDLREVVRVIVTSPEFFAAETRRAKIKNAVRVRHLGAACHRRRRAGHAAAGADAAATGHAPLSLPAPDGVQGDGRRVGDQRRARHSHELRGGVGHDGGARASVDTLLYGEASETTRATIGKATTPAQAVALALGSPEFQRR